MSVIEHPGIDLDSENMRAIRYRLTYGQPVTLRQQRYLYELLTGHKLDVRPKRHAECDGEGCAACQWSGCE